MTKFKAPQGFQAACTLLAKLPTQALLLGPDAKRKYPTHQGPWDADYFDRAAQSLQTLVDSGVLAADEARQVRWNLSAVYWMVGQRDTAECMTASLVDDPACDAGMRNAATRQLGEIRAGRTPFGTKANTKNKVVVAEVAKSEATLAPMLDSDWVPYFTSPIAGLADALDEGADLPLAAGNGPLRLAVFANEDFPPISPADVGRSGRYLILSAAADKLMAAYVPDDAHRRALHIEGHGDYALIDLSPHDCLVEVRSSVRRARSGRLIVQRGLFDPARIGDRKLFRPLGSHEIFVAPAIARDLRQRFKNAGFKGVRIKDDVMSRG